MPARYKLSFFAEEDFASILYDIAVHSGWSRSMDVEEGLYAAFNTIAEHPGIGHLREDLLLRVIRFHYADPYMILYLSDLNPIYVVAVVHGARDIASIMQDRIN